MLETPSYVPQTVAQLQQLNVVSGAVYNLSVCAASRVQGVVFSSGTACRAPVAYINALQLPAFWHTYTSAKQQVLC